MEIEIMLRKVARKAVRLLRSWGVNEPIFVTNRRPDIPTFWGYDWWWEPDFVFRLGDDEVGAYSDKAKIIRTYCGMFVDGRIDTNRCYREKDLEPLKFPIHFFVALNAFAAYAVDLIGERGHMWFSVSPNSVLLGYRSKSSSVLLTIYSYHKAKLEIGGKEVKRGTLRQLTRHFMKILTIDLI